MTNTVYLVGEADAHTTSEYRAIFFTYGEALSFAEAYGLFVYAKSIDRGDDEHFVGEITVGEA